jgi:predicted nucleic acid-binding protein
LYCDSSALVKRFVNEPGAAWVRQLIDPSARNRIYVARITGVEVVSALARNAHLGTISPAGYSAALLWFRQEFVHRYQTIPISPTLIEEAMEMAERHALRGYDAVQLAAALRVRNRRLAQNLSAPILVSADAALNAAALAEGLAVDDPNNHP